MNYDTFRERFEVDDDPNGSNSFLFTTTGCMNRFNVPRVEMMNPPEREVRRDWEEHELQCNVAQLLSKGCKLTKTETLEHFVIRNINKLDLV